MNLVVFLRLTATGCFVVHSESVMFFIRSMIRSDMVGLARGHGLSSCRNVLHIPVEIALRRTLALLHQRSDVLAVLRYYQLNGCISPVAINLQNIRHGAQQIFQCFKTKLPERNVATLQQFEVRHQVVYGHRPSRIGIHYGTDPLL
uniref:Putative secreted protein n=1 Tax=Anopheles triannulatus TaxID=58253 RepID=A0A2M4B5F0_9DIPT